MSRWGPWYDLCPLKKNHETASSKTPNVMTQAQLKVTAVIGVTVGKQRMVQANKVQTTMIALTMALQGSPRENGPGRYLTSSCCKDMFSVSALMNSRRVKHPVTETSDLHRRRDDAA